jgi:hypothetical protein
MTKEENRLYQANWRASNLEKCRAASRKCQAKRRLLYPSKVQDAQKAYRTKNKAKIREAQRKRRVGKPFNYTALTAEQRAQRAEKMKAWRKKNPQKVAKQQLRAREKSKESRREYAIKYGKINRKLITAKEVARYHSDPEHRLKKVLRNRIASVLYGKRKSAPSSELLGCSIQEARSWLESKFTSAMTWENAGQYWHIDHIIPCRSFDLNKPDHQRICFHFTNLRPIYWKQNLQKQGKITHPQISLPL